MRSLLFGHGTPAILVAFVVMTQGTLAKASTAPVTPTMTSADAAALPDKLPGSTPAPLPPLDVSARTLRDAARASADATSDSAGDRLPADRSQGFKDLPPTCSRLLAVAELVAVLAVCATDHCGYDGSALDRTPVAGSSSRPRPITTGCPLKGARLW